MLIRYLPLTYVDLRFPTYSTALLAPLQSHPFVLASWSEAPLLHLDILVEPREGLTRLFLHYMIATR